MDDAPDASLQEQRELCFAPEHHGERLDRVLAALLPEFSRSYLQDLIAQGDVQVQGRPVTKPATRVQAGAAAQVVLRPTPQSQAFRPEAGEIAVVYEDDHLLVIDKPPGLVVHPAPGHWSGTLMNRLLGRDARAMTLPRAGIVHRLDKDTSGLMLVARSRVAMEALVRALAARTVSRKYLALVHGAWSHPNPLDVEQPIGRDPHNRMRMAVVPPGNGKPAHSSLTCLRQSGTHSLLHCSLHTGRTHQIRVHCAWLGHALVGDAVYGARGSSEEPRQALHATWLALQHPVDGRALAFFAPLPDDFVRMQHALGLDYNVTPDGLPSCF